MHLDHCNILPTCFPVPSLAVPCATDAVLHVQDHIACQWWCWNLNLNLGYLRNKSTRKEKGLKLIFTTIYPMWTATLSLLLLFSDYYQPQANWWTAFAVMMYPVTSLHLCPGCLRLWPVISSVLSCSAPQPELSSLGRMSQVTTSHDTDSILPGLTLLLGKNPYFPNHPTPNPIQSLVNRLD